MNQGPRIVLIVPSFPKLSESFIVNKFLGLLQRNWDAHVVCQTSSNAEWNQLPDSDMFTAAQRRVHRVWTHRPRWLGLGLLPAALLHSSLRNPQGTWDYLRRGWSRFGTNTIQRLYLDATTLALRPDVVHFEFGSLAADGMHWKRANGCKTVVSFRGFDLNFSGLESPDYYQDVWQRADCLHLLGEDLWRRAQSRGCPADKLHFLIPPAIDATFFDPQVRQPAPNAGTNERPLRVLSLGRLEWKKGHEYGLQAIRMLHDRGIHCHHQIIGAGAHLDAVAFERHQLGLTDTVEILGALPRDKVREKLQEADVLLHAATSEGFCNAVLEGQSMKLPVVCSDADGLSENVVDGQTGFVVHRRNPKALADRLAQLAADLELRHRMGEAGRRRVLEHFTLDRQLDAFEAMYRHVLSTNPADGS